MKYFHLVAGTCPTNSTHEGTKHKTLNGLNPGVISYNSVNCDRPGECSPEKDCLR